MANPAHLDLIYVTPRPNGEVEAVGYDGRPFVACPDTLAVACEDRFTWIYENALEARLAARQFGWCQPARFECWRTANCLLERAGESLPADSFKGCPDGGAARDLWRQFVDGTLLARLRAADLEFVYRNIELPLVDVVAGMRQRGLGFDMAELSRIQATARREGLELSKLCELSNSLDPVTHRIHAKLDLIGDVAGCFRLLKASLPCLDRRLRSAIVPAAGYVLVEAAYWDTKPRLLAELADDQPLLAAFAADEHIPSMVAAEVLGKKLGAVTTRDRDIAKSVMYTVLSGGEPENLAGRFDVTKDVATSWIDRFYAAHPAIRAWTRHFKQTLLQRGYVQTPYGRRRQLFDATAAATLTDAEYRRGIYTILEGTVADIQKLGLIRLADSMPSRWHLVLTVNNCVLVEVPQAESQEALHQVQEILQSPPPRLKSSFRVNVGSGNSWAACGECD